MIEARPETPADIAAIRQVNLAAFGAHPNEAQLVELLRERGQAPISLVAVSEAKVVGHIMFSPITIAFAPPAIRGLGLAPLAVLPQFQKQGLGSQLVVQGLQDCRQRGFDLVVVLGNPHYYSRFGFLRAKDYQLDNEYNADEPFRVIELQPGRLSRASGLVKYAPEFKEADC